MNDKPIIWKGIYETFDEAAAHMDAPMDVDAFVSERWVERSTAKARDNIALAADGGTIPNAAHMHEYPLAVAVGMLAATRETVRILDFGGGIGFSAPHVLSSVPADLQVEFLIVDNAETCALGRDMFADEPRVTFTEELPATTRKFDILHCGSSMQYIDDWRGILQKFSEYDADYMIFSDLPAGDIPSYVTLQVYYDHLIPYRLWNLGEFIAAMDTLDYKLIFQTNHIKATQNTVGPRPMDNFSENHRLAHDCHLIFSNKRQSKVTT